jgi:flagellar motility protein MotE (MotC chaperone)
LKGQMDYYAINALREKHPGWALLRAQNAPLALHFFISAFTDPNQRNVGRQQLIDVLDDVLFGVRETYGEEKFPRNASEYLDDWAASERAWLRKYYVQGEDEPHYDLTPAAEDVVRWVESLKGREFVATQSRLTSIFAVLKTLVQQSETDPDVRLAELQQQRDQIDAEMQRIREGDLKVMTAPEALDHFQQLTTLAKDLLSDFREVEQNFRKLDRQVREQIATWDGSQGELLDSIFANQQDIGSSLQGRTFQGFWDYLMSPQLRRELNDLLHRATQIEALARMDNLHTITNLHQDWLPAVEQTQATVRQLSQQMRRLLDDKVFLENKRIMQLIRSIEANALDQRDQPPSNFAMEIEASSVDVALPFERPLYEPGSRVMVMDDVVTADDQDLDASALFSQFHVDRERLKFNIESVLEEESQATLADITAAHPLSQGLAEIVAYYQLAAESDWASINPETTQRLHWTLEDGSVREAVIDQIIFVRPA